MLDLLGNAEYLFIAITSRSTLAGTEAPDRLQLMDQIEVNCLLLLNWIFWKRIVYMYKNGFGIK